ARTTAGGVTRRLADISAAERDLGWKPTMDLHEGLADLVEWWKSIAKV
ncbi:MAG: NAD-dependent epimerase, partial [Actinomycetota bacterium]|nr:NAD-dependent epimerase [Actinomycetota bacterium]